MKGKKIISLLGQKDGWLAYRKTKIKSTERVDLKTNNNINDAMHHEAGERLVTAQFQSSRMTPH